MNWQGTLYDVFVLAHEFGHLAHSVFTAEAQPYVSVGNPPFLAKIASLTNGVLLARHLLRTVRAPEARAHMLSRALDVINKYMFSQAMLTEMQVEAHRMAEQGEPLTYDSITAANTAVLRKWYGEAVEITDEGHGSSWCEVLHHLRNFYGFEYVTGVAAAMAFADPIEGEGEPAVERYLRLLGAGPSQQPLELLVRPVWISARRSASSTLWHRTRSGNMS